MRNLVLTVRNALSKATPGYSGFEKFTNADIYVAINGVEWLRQLCDQAEAQEREIERLNKENAELRERLTR